MQHILQDLRYGARMMRKAPGFLLLRDVLANETLVRTDVPVLVKGGYSRRDQGSETPTFIVESLEPFAEKRVNGEVGVAIDLTPDARLLPAVMQDVRAVIEAHATTHASAPAVELRWTDGAGQRERLRSRTLRLSATQAALTDLRNLLGTERVRLVRGS